MDAVDTSTSGPAVHVGPRAEQRLEDAEAIVCFGDDGPQQIAAMVDPGIRWVQLPHAGVDAYADAGIITARPVRTSAAGAFAPQVAEHAVALMLAGARGLAERARASTWDQQGARTSGRSFAGSAVALLGARGIGATDVGRRSALDPSRQRRPPPFLSRAPLSWP